MENNKTNMEFKSDVDTSSDNVDTSNATNLEDDMLSNFSSDIENENDLAEQEKIKELNKNLPSWSLEPPHTFIK